MPEEHHHAEETVKLFFRGFLPSLLFAGAVVILALRIPGWSLLLGAPLTVIGAVLLIFTIDEIARVRIMPHPYVTSCSVCGKPTPVIPGVPEKDTICAICKRDVKKGLGRWK